MRTEDKKKHHARKLSDGNYEFDGKKEEVGGGGGSTVTWTSSSVTAPRKQIGAINIDGVETRVYAPNPSVPSQTIARTTVKDFMDSSHWDRIPNFGLLTNGTEKAKFCKSEVCIMCPNSGGMIIHIVQDDAEDDLALYTMDSPGILKLTLMKNVSDDYYTLYAESINEYNTGLSGLLIDEISGNLIVSDLDIDKVYGLKTVPEVYFVTWGDEDERIHYLCNYTEYYDVSATTATDTEPRDGDMG